MKKPQTRKPYPRNPLEVTSSVFAATGNTIRVFNRETYERFTVTGASQAYTCSCGGTGCAHIAEARKLEVRMNRPAAARPARETALPAYRTDDAPFSIFKS
jgi:hypothetical protein